MAWTQESLQLDSIFNVRHCRKRAHYSWRHSWAYLCKAPWSAWRAYSRHLLGQRKDLRWTRKRGIFWRILETNEKERFEKKTGVRKRAQNGHQSQTQQRGIKLTVSICRSQLIHSIDILFFTSVLRDFTNLWSF